MFEGRKKLLLIPLAAGVLGACSSSEQVGNQQFYIKGDGRITADDLKKVCPNGVASIVSTDSVRALVTCSDGSYVVPPSQGAPDTGEGPSLPGMRVGD